VRNLTNLSKILTSADASSSAVISRGRRVVVDTLYSNIVCSERLLQRKNEGRANNTSDIACLGGSAGEDQGEGLADAIDDIVTGYANGRYTLAAGDCACNLRC
jgi:hypothetical protein